MTASSRGIECCTSVLCVQQRHVVCCEVDHFIPSGVSVHDLFAQLRPHLVSAIEEAARRNVSEAVPPRAPRVQMDVGQDDPGFALWVYSPSANVDSVDGALQQLEAIMTRFAAGQRALGIIQS